MSSRRRATSPIASSPPLALTLASRALIVLTSTPQESSDGMLSLLTPVIICHRSRGENWVRPVLSKRRLSLLQVILMTLGKSVLRMPLEHPQAPSKSPLPLRTFRLRLKLLRKSSRRCMLFVSA